MNTPQSTPGCMVEAHHTDTQAMPKADFEALATFRYQLRLFLRFSEELCQANGITPLQYQLLLQIKGYPGRPWATVTELSERLQAKHHGMVALISRCEGLGLVRRQSSAVDQRRVEVHLTAEGERYVDLLARQHREELETFSAMADLPRHPR